MLNAYIGKTLRYLPGRHLPERRASRYGQKEECKGEERHEGVAHRAPGGDAPLRGPQPHRGEVPRTVEWYTEVLDRFCRWLEAKRRSTVVQAIDEMTVRLFIVHYQTRPGTKAPTMSTHTVYNLVSALRAFFSWLHPVRTTPRRTSSRT